MKLLNNIFLRNKNRIFNIKKIQLIILFTFISINFFPFPLPFTKSINWGSSKEDVLKEIQNQKEISLACDPEGEDLTFVCNFNDINCALSFIFRENQLVAIEFRSQQKYIDFEELMQTILELIKKEFGNPNISRDNYLKWQTKTTNIFLYKISSSDVNNIQLAVDIQKRLKHLGN